jgi:chromosome segregation ATPase
MEPYHLWREEYRREVEKVLDEMRAGKDEAAPGPMVMDLADGIIPPSKARKELQAALAEVAALRTRVEELTSGLEAKSRELEAELRRRGRLKDLVIKLHLQVGALQGEAQEARHGMQDGLDKSRRYFEAAQQAQARLQEVLQQLEAEQQRVRQAHVRAASLQGGLDELQIQLDAKERAFNVLLARYDVSEKDYLERLRRFEAKVGELETSLDEARRRSAGVDALEAGYRRQLQEAAAAGEARLERLERVHHASVEQWEADCRELQRRLDEARQVKESLETRLEGALRQNDELRQQAAQARREALKLEDEVTQRALEAGRALQAERLRLQEETGQAQRESSARRAEADGLLAEARRREAAAGKALLDARQVRVAAADVAEALRREKERLLGEVEGEKERLRAGYEAKSGQAEAERRAELESLRCRLRQLTECQAAGEADRERLRAQQESERRRILDETREKLEGLRQAPPQEPEAHGP